jgi:hypothetical protein
MVVIYEVHILEVKAQVGFTKKIILRFGRFVKFFKDQWNC